MRTHDAPKLVTTLGWKVAARLFHVDRIHRIQGGLANQMFQYAHAWALQHHHPARTFVDLSRYRVAPPDRAYRIEEVFEMPDRFPRLPPSAARWISRWGLDRSNRSEELTVAFKDAFVRNDIRGVVQGYFPSFRYCAGVEGLVRRNFRFSRPLPARSLGLADRLLDPDSVAVHVRRGDYLNPENKADFFGMCTPLYYRAAGEYIRARRPSARFYFFSDDPGWCREEFKDMAHCVVDGHTGEDAWVDMALMSRCASAVIANSSFSLWSRWLAASADGINIGPSRFFNNGAYGARTEDILPASFIRMNESGEIA